MDFHALPRRDLQALAKRNGIRANMSNGAMADALAALPAVDGIEEYIQEPVAEPTPAADEQVVQVTAEEEEEEEEPEKQEISLPGGQGLAALTPHEVIVLDDSEEEENNLSPGENEEKALGAGRRRANRRTRVEPVAAPATRKRAAASKADKADTAVEAVPARATRARSQRTVVAEEEAPKTRRTSRRAVASKTGTEQEEEEKRTHGDVSDVEADVPALVSSDEGCDGAGEMEVAIDAQNEEQNEPVEEQSQADDGEAEKGYATADAVPTRATRARSQRKVLSVAQEEEQRQEDEVGNEKGDTAADAVPARATRARSQRTVLSVAHEEEQGQEEEVETEKGDAAVVAVPARATRARSQRTVLSAAEKEEAPKTRRTSRRAAASKTCMQQEVEEKGAQRVVSDVEAAVPAPASSDEGSDGAEVAQNEEQKQSQEDDGETQKGDAAAEAVPARATRARRQRTAEPVAEEEVPKARRTSRRAAASDVSDVEAAVPAPASSDEGGDGAEAMEVVKDAQNGPVEEQSQGDEGQTEKGDAAVEAVPARATRARRQRAVVSAAEDEEAPKTRRTSRRATARKTSTEQEQGEKATRGDVSDMEAAPVSSTERDDGAEEMEVAVAAQNEEHLAAAEAVPARATRARSRRTVVSVADDEAPKAKRTSRRAVARKTRTEQEEEEKATQGDVSQVKEAVLAPVSSEEEGDTGTEEVEVATNAQNEEQNEIAAEQCPEEEGVVAEEEPPVAEDCMVDSSVEEQLVDVQQCEDSPVVLGLAEQERSDTYQNDAEDTEMVPNDEVLQTPLKSDEPTEEVAFTSNVGHDSEEFEVPTPVEVLQSAAKAIDEHEEMAVDVVTNITDVSVEDMAGHASEENEDCTVEEELAVAEDVDSSVQEPLVDVQPCEATEEIHLAGEDAEMVAEAPQAMLESGEATEKFHCSSDVAEESEEESPVAEHADLVQEPLVDVQQCVATEQIHLASEDAEMVAVLESGEATEEVDCTSDVAEESEEEPPVAEHVDSSVQEPLVDVQQCEDTEENHPASEDTEMVPVLESGETTEECYFTGNVGYAGEKMEAPASDEVFQSTAKAVEEIDVPTSDEVLQSPAKAAEENEDTAADEVPHNTDEYVEEEAVVATDEMPQASEAMDQDVVEVVTVENLTQGTVTDDECAIKESGFTADLTDVSMEEEAAVTADEMSLAAMGESVKEEVVTVQIMSQATLTCDVKESGFSGDLTDVSLEDKEVVAADGMPQSSATMEANVEEVITVGNLSQATVTDDQGAVKESVFSCGLAVLSVDEESSETMSKDVEEVATEADDEWAVTESAFTGDCTPVVDTARDFSDHIASPLSANVFEDATKSLSITMEPMVSESADVQLCMYSSSGGEKNTSEPVAVQRENEPEATSSDRIMHSPLSIRKVRMAVAQEIEADSVPRCLTIRKQPRTNLNTEKMAVQPENEVQEGNQPEAAAFGRIMHSPLSIRKLRMAVAQENEADSVPRCLTIRKQPRTNLNIEKMAVQPENEVQEGNQPEAGAFGRMMHSPLSIRRLRMAVAQENEAGRVCLTIRKLSRTNLSEKVTVVAQENEVQEGEQSSVPLDELSLRKLRVKLRETLNTEKMAVQPENEVQEANQPEAAAFGRIMHSPLSIRKLRMAVAQENEAGSVCLTVRKLSRTSLGEKAAVVAQENEVKEGEKSSVPLDKLSLRKLRIRLRETLNAHKNMEPKRVPLGRLDENAR